MGHLQVVDAAESAVVKDQDVGLAALLHDGAQLGVEHLETGVTDAGVLFDIGLCHLDAEGCADFVTHAAVAVLYMVAAALVGLPYTLHAAGKGTAGSDDDIIGAHAGAQGSEGCSLSQGCAIQTIEFRNSSGISCLDDGLEVLACADDAAEALKLSIPLSLGISNLVGVCALVALCTKDLSQSCNSNLSIADSLDSVELVCMVTAVVDGYETNVFVLEEPLGAGGEVAHSGADGDDAVSFLSQLVGSGCAGYADTAKAVRMTGLAGALSALGLAEGDAELFAEVLDHFTGQRVADAAAYDNEGLLGSKNLSCNIFQLFLNSAGTSDAVNSLLEEALGIIIVLTLNVLRKADGNCTGLSGICEDAHSIDHSAHQLLRPLDAIPVFNYGLESIVCGRCKAVGLLELLQNGIGLSGSECICREYQQRNVVNSSSCAGNNHVCGAGAYGSCAGDDLLAVILLCESSCSVAHTLLVTALHDVDSAGIAVKSLTEADCDAVSEDCEEIFDELGLFAIHADILIVKEFDDRLCCCQSDCFFHIIPHHT